MGLGEAEYREALNTLKGIHRMCFNNRNMYKRRALEAEVGSIPEAAPLEVSEGDSTKVLSESLKRKNEMFDSDDEDKEEVEEIQTVIDSYEVSTFFLHRHCAIKKLMSTWH